MQSLPNQIHVALRGLATLLFERMQHIHGFDELGDVHDPVFHRSVNAYLGNARSHARHRPPVVRLQLLLNPSKLEACKPSSICGKGPDIVAARSKPHQRPIAHDPVCNYLHIGSSRLWHESPNPAIETDAKRTRGSSPGRSARAMPKDVVRVVTWNCAMAFRRKLSEVAGLAVHVLAVQECSRDDAE